MIMGFPFDLPEGDPCFFCEIISGRKEKGIVEETEMTLTLVNGRQFETGQVVVVPRRHAPTLFDLTDDEATALFLAARRVGRAIVDAYNSDGMLLYQNNGVVSHQEIPHFHLHVVPLRAADSNWGSGPPHIAAIEVLKFRRPKHSVTISVEEEHKVAQKIRLHL